MSIIHWICKILSYKILKSTVGVEEAYIFIIYTQINAKRKKERKKNYLWTSHLHTMLHTTRPPTSQNSLDFHEYKKLHLILMAGQEFAPPPVNGPLTTGTRLTTEKASFKRAARSAKCDTLYKNLCTSIKFLPSFNQVFQSMKWICMHMGRGTKPHFSLVMRKLYITKVNKPIGRLESF